MIIVISILYYCWYRHGSFCLSRNSREIFVLWKKLRFIVFLSRQSYEFRKLQGGIFVLYMPIREDRFCLKIWWPGNYFQSQEMVNDVTFLCLSAQIILKIKLFLLSF